MSQPSSSFQDLFNAALQQYENQTGCKLIEHPLAKQFETCDSVESITAILREQTQIFSSFKGDDGKLMKSLKSSVGVLYTLSNTGVFGGSIGLVHPTIYRGYMFLTVISQVFPPASAVFAGIAILLAVCPLIRSHLHVSDLNSAGCQRYQF